MHPCHDICMIDLRQIQISSIHRLVSYIDVSLDIHKASLDNNNNNFIWVLNFPVSSMDFTNKLIYIYDTQKGNMTIFKQYE